MADSLSNAALAQQISTLLSAWSTREAEFKNWVGGTATGGPNGDGRYPLSDYLGTSYLISCPAALSSSVSGPAVAAGTSATTAQSAATTAQNAATSADQSNTSAQAALTAAQQARDLAISARDNAGTYAANAQAYAQSASTSASAASSSQSSASSSATAASGSATAAANSATAAANSAAAAATFNPALFLAKTGGTVTGSLTITTGTNDLIQLCGDGGSIEISRNGGSAYIDLKDSTSKDFDVRLQANGTVLDIGASNVRLNGNSLWHVGNFNPANYLPLSGGTLSGNLVLPAGGVIYTGNMSLIQFPSANGNIVVTRSNSANSAGVSFQTSDGVTRGYAYADNTNTQGFLRDDGGWRLLANDGGAFRHNNAGAQFTLWDTGNFNPGSKLDTSGGSINGTLRVVAWPAAQNTDTFYLQPTDWGVGKPGLYMKQNGATWSLQLWDSSSAAGIINIAAEGGLTVNGNQVWHGANFNPANYLPLSGGTMTGDLNMSASLQLSSEWGWNGFIGGTGDGASFTTYNTALKLWWGLGLVSYDGAVNGYYDARSGTWNVKGGYQVNGNSVWHSGNFSPTVWTSDINWNTGVNVKVPGESSFDVYSGGLWSVWDAGDGGSAIAIPYGGQVQIGAAGYRGLGVVGNLGVNGSASFTGSITVSSNNATGGGIILSDDGDIVDPNTGYCAMRFSAGVQIYSGNKGGSSVITLGSDGQIKANGAIYASSGRRVPERLDGRGSAGITFSTEAPSGGSDGDIWFVYT